MARDVRSHDVLVSGSGEDLPEAVARVLAASRLDGAPPGEPGWADAAGMRWATRTWGARSDPPLLLAHGIMSDGGVY